MATLLCFNNNIHRVEESEQSSVRSLQRDWSVSAGLSCLSLGLAGRTCCCGREVATSSALCQPPSVKQLGKALPASLLGREAPRVWTPGLSAHILRAQELATTPDPKTWPCVVGACRWPKTTRTLAEMDVFVREMIQSVHRWTAYVYSFRANHKEVVPHRVHCWDLSGVH